MSLIITEILEVTSLAGAGLVLTLILKVCGPSVVASATGVTINVPWPRLLMVKNPLASVRSAASAEPFLYAQYNVVPVATFVVVTLNVNGEPSSIDVTPFDGATAYVGLGGGVRLVSTIVTALLVASLNVLTADVRIPTVNVSEPSVVASAVGVTVNVPAPLTPVVVVIVTVPLLSVKSPALVNTAQYNVVGDARLVVVTVKVNDAPSLTELAAGVTIYVGGGGV